MKQAISVRRGHPYSASHNNFDFCGSLDFVHEKICVNHLDGFLRRRAGQRRRGGWLPNSLNMTCSQAKDYIAKNDGAILATGHAYASFHSSYCSGQPQESPHFENGLISALFGPHVQRMGSPKAPHLLWRDLSLDDCETRTRTSGLVIRDSPHQNANLQLHFGPRKNEGMAEQASPLLFTPRTKGIVSSVSIAIASWCIASHESPHS